MTLHEYNDVEQGTGEWHDLRRGIVTASVIGQLITPKTIKAASNPESRRLTSLLVAERITGWTESTYTSWEMQRGIDDEPRARDLYAEHYGTPVRTAGFMVEDKWGYRIGFSPDSLVADHGLIECKSRAPKAHVETILADEVPAENMAQIQCGLLVSGREWADYLSYCSGMPMYRKRVLPDERWQTAILEAVESFETTAAEMVAKYEGAVVGLPKTERTTYEEMMVI